LLKESYDKGELFGSNWRLDDLWDTYYLIRNVTRKMNELQELRRVTWGEDMTIEEYMERLNMEDYLQPSALQAYKILHEYPENKKFMDVKRVFGFNHLRDLANNTIGNDMHNRVPALLKLITGYTTDLNKMETEASLK
jgi:hypothetical protein